MSKTIIQLKSVENDSSLYPITDSRAVYHNDERLSEIIDSQTNDYLNVNVVNNHPTPYDSSVAARNAIDSSYRELGLCITHLSNDSSSWIQEQFIGSSVSSNWTSNSNWQPLGPVSVINQMITVGNKPVTGVVSVSQNTQTGHTNINIGGDSHPIPSVGEVTAIQDILGINGTVSIGKILKSNGTLADNSNYYVTPFIPFGGGNFFARASEVSSIAYFVAYNSSFQIINTWLPSNSTDIERNNLDSSYAYVRGSFKMDKTGYISLNSVIAWDNRTFDAQLVPAKQSETLNLIATISSLVTELRTKGRIFGGIRLHGESPVDAAPSYGVFYIAGDDGIYDNFSGLELQRGAIIVNLVTQGQFTTWLSPFDRRLALDTDISTLTGYILNLEQIYPCLLNNTKHSTMPILDSDRDIAYGYRVKSDGTIENPAAAADYYATPFIPVCTGTLVWTVSELNNNFFLAYYDENKVLQNSWSANAASRSADITAKGYIRASFKKNGVGSVTLRNVTIWDNIANIEDYTLVKKNEISSFVTQTQAQQIAEDAVAQLDVTEAVNNWMDAHPEATTTVQDGSITEAKLATDLAAKAAGLLVTGETTKNRWSTHVGYSNGNPNAAGGKNVIVGSENMMGASTAEKNVAVGYHSSYRVTTATDNTTVGNEAGDNLSTGTQNTALGGNALRMQSAAQIGEPRSGNYNTCIGYNTMYRSHGESNTCIGAYALFGGSYDAEFSGCLALGYFAGNHNPSSSNNKFYLDNRYRDAQWKEEQQGMMYGEFNDDPASQKLRINVGNFALPYLPTSDPLVAGVLWNDSGTAKISAGV